MVQHIAQVWLGRHYTSPLKDLLITAAGQCLPHKSREKTGSRLKKLYSKDIWQLLTPHNESRTAKARAITLVLYLDIHSSLTSERPNNRQRWGSYNNCSISKKLQKEAFKATLQKIASVFSAAFWWKHTLPGEKGKAMNLLPSHLDHASLFKTRWEHLSQGSEDMNWIYGWEKEPTRKAFLTSTKFYHDLSSSIIMHLRDFLLLVPYDRDALCSNLSYHGTHFTNPWNS